MDIRVGFNKISRVNHSRLILSSVVAFSLDMFNTTVSKIRNARDTFMKSLNSECVFVLILD